MLTQQIAVRIGGILLTLIIGGVLHWLFKDSLLQESFFKFIFWGILFCLAWLTFEISDLTPEIPVTFKSKERQQEELLENRLEAIEARKNEIIIEYLEKDHLSCEEFKDKMSKFDFAVEKLTEFNNQKRLT